MAPSTRSAGYRCSLPGLAGFTGVPSPGTAPYVSQNAAEIQRDRGERRGKTVRMAADKDKLTVGQKAPAFSLPDQDDKPTKLGDFKGSWLVLYFYPNDDTPGCTTEACDFTNGLKDFEKLEAVVVGCSPNTTESHRKFIAKYKLKVRLLSDPEHKAMEAYGAWGEKVLYGKKSIGVIRSTAIISPDGKIAHHWARVKAAGHAEAVREKLKELGAA
jgi:thioredoxin-dependent peroxiredoxin